MKGTDQEYRVLITGEPMVDEAMEILGRRTSYRLTSSYPSKEMLIALAKEDAIDGMIVRQGPITREVLDSSPKLRGVVKHGVGVDNIDVEAATGMSIPVCITAHANFQSVAEHVLAVMLAFSKCLSFHDREIRQGHWARYEIMTTDLLGKCLGIVGLGRIGRRLAEVVQPLQMQVIGYDPYLPQSRTVEPIHRVESLDGLLQEADYLSIHCAKTPETVNLIGERELEMMKPTAVLINTARGGIINEPALVRALEEEQIAGVGLDCFETEPLPADHPLLAFADRLVLSPHIAGDTAEALHRTGTQAVRILLDCLDGKELDLAVLLNPEVLSRR